MNRKGMLLSSDSDRLPCPGLAAQTWTWQSMTISYLEMQKVNAKTPRLRKKSRTDLF
jgi:hypothetical protein